MKQSEKDNTDKPKRFYDKGFNSSTEYRDSLPDMQNASSNTITGANVAINQVGISNFKLPLKFPNAGKEPLMLETSITGTVSLKSGAKGINMSRILRVFYDFKDEVFSWETIKKILQEYKQRLSSENARVKLFFNYPLIQKSLRSNLEGYQYYKVMLEASLDSADKFRKFIQIDFVYSSACPCSDELSEHARERRNVYSIPHSQRSNARVIAEVEEGAHLFVQDMQRLCNEGLKTETQVMVRREDEQAFAELNGAYIKFVEDAARLLFDSFNSEKQISDFQISIAHLESLHSHDAIATITKGIEGGFSGCFEDFRNLIC